MTMKRQIDVGILLALGLLLSGAGHPELAVSDNPCSLRTLNGTYAYHCSGVHLGNGQPVYVAFAGKDHYNGDGTMSGVYSFSENGVISHNISYTGTYTVNPDCTGTVTTKDVNGVVVHADLFFGRDGEEVHFMLTDDGVVDAAVERRVGK
jgi:hypothetical protein